MTEQPVNYGEPVQMQPVPAAGGTSNETTVPPATQDRDGGRSAPQPEHRPGELPQYQVVENGTATQDRAYHADEPRTLPSVAPNQLSGSDLDAPPSETGVVTAQGTAPSVMVRLADVLAHVENWLARHPEVRGLEADLKSGLATVERHGGPPATGTTPYQDAVPE